MNGQWKKTPHMWGGGVLVDQIFQTPFGKLTGNPNKTVEYFLKFTGPNNWKDWIVGYGTSNDSGSFYPYINQICGVGRSGNIDSSSATTTEYFRVLNNQDSYWYDKWFHVAGTYDGSVARLFVDGKLILYRNQSYSHGSTPFYIGYCTHWQIGRQNGDFAVAYPKVSDICRYTENFISPKLLDYGGTLSSNLKVGD